MNNGFLGLNDSPAIFASLVQKKISVGISQTLRNFVILQPTDNSANYGSTQYPTSLVMCMPVIRNNGMVVSVGSLSLSVPDGTTIGGDARGNGAVDLQVNRNNAAQVASGGYSFISGMANKANNAFTTVNGAYNTAAGLGATVSGYGNTANGDYAFISGNSNTAGGLGATATGMNNVANAPYSFSGGFYCSATGAGNAFAFGAYAAASSLGATALGYSVTANSAYSMATGNSSTTNSIIAKRVHGNLAGAQIGDVLCSANTNTATPAVLTTNNSAPTASNQCTLQNDNTIAFTAEIVARDIGTGDSARWEAKGLIKRGANASTTTLVGTPTVTVTHNDAGAATWVIALSADTTNGALAITATGEAGKEIKWLAKISTTEIM